MTTRTTRAERAERFDRFAATVGRTSPEDTATLVAERDEWETAELTDAD